MKKITLSITMLLAAVSISTAQGNVDVKEETTIKKVRVSDKYGAEVKVTKQTEKEVGVLQLNDTNQEDQSATTVTQKLTDDAEVTNETIVDVEKMKKAKEENDRLIMQNKLQQQREIEMSEAEALKMAEKQRIEIEAKQKMMEKERLERKAVLEREVGQSKKEAKMQSDALKKAEKEAQKAKRKAEKEAKKKIDN